MKISYRPATNVGQVLRRIAELSPRTVLLDVEPLVAYWDTDEVALRNGVNTLINHVASVPGVAVVGFATNSRRRLPTTPSERNVLVFYLATAQKPLRTAPYKILPKPGVLVGDQIATDGVLAWRLGYSFVHYRPGVVVPRGPGAMSGLGRLIEPFLFRRSR